MSNASKIVTVDGKYHVWTRRVGEGPVKMLLLHGGPGCTHEYFECFENHLPGEGMEFYYYDQLGSYYSDQPDDDSLCAHDTMRVEDVEEMGRRIPRAEVKVCEEGSHLAFWDDSERYFNFLLGFVKKIEAGRE